MQSSQLYILICPFISIPCYILLNSITFCYIFLYPGNAVQPVLYPAIHHASPPPLPTRWTWIVKYHLKHSTFFCRYTLFRISNNIKHSYIDWDCHYFSRTTCVILNYGNFQGHYVVLVGCQDQQLLYRNPTVRDKVWIRLWPFPLWHFPVPQLLHISQSDENFAGVSDAKGSPGGGANSLWNWRRCDLCLSNVVWTVKHQWET